MSRLGKIEKLLADTGPDVSTDRDELYERKIAKEIDQLERFIAQADIALASLQQIQPVNNKAHVIALHEMYLKVPYVPGKDEVGGTALTDFHLQKLTEKHGNQILWLKENMHSLGIQTMIDDMNGIISELDTAIASNQAKVDVLSEKSSRLQASENYVESPVDDLTNEASDMSKLLKSNLQRVLTKFIALQAQSLDKDTLKLALKSVTKMVLKLLKSQDWVQIVPDEFNVMLIKVLMYNSIVTRRDDSSVDGYYLKMTLFA